MSDSPGLSDLSEDLNGGHRTSTPNMSKQKRAGGAPELHFIKKQIGGANRQKKIFRKNVL